MERTQAKTESPAGAPWRSECQGRGTEGGGPGRLMEKYDVCTGIHTQCVCVPDTYIYASMKRAGRGGRGERGRLTPLCHNATKARTSPALQEAPVLLLAHTSLLQRKHFFSLCLAFWLFLFKHVSLSNVIKSCLPQRLYINGILVPFICSINVYF